MIKVFEKDFLDDTLIKHYRASNIGIKERINFNSKDIYYFGNYQEDKLNKVRKKIIGNYKNIKRAIERKAKIIVTGNSCNLFNSTFKPGKSISLFIAYDPKKFRRAKLSRFIRINKVRKTEIKKIYSLDEIIDSENFSYKNLYYIDDSKNVNVAIKKLKTK